MNKSKYVFLIMFFGYITIAVLKAFNVTSVGDEILLGLSLCAMTMSLSDCVLISKVILIKANQSKYIAKVTSIFINTKLEQNNQFYSTSVNIRNVKKNIELTNKGYEKSQHPALYDNKKLIKLLRIIEIILFTISIFIFVMTPFAKISVETSTKATVFITLVAFGFMCLNIFLSEIDAKKSEKIHNFFNNSQIIINSVFPDFSNFLSNQLYYREDLIAAEEAHKEKINQETNEDKINNIEEL